MNGHEILPAVHEMCSGGGRVPVGLTCRCVDQGEVAPLFSVWMRDKRNRGCFGQTLFGHGQSTYKRGYHLSLSLSLWPDLRALFVPSRLSRASSFTQLSRVPCTRRVLTQIPSPPIAFSLALCLMNAHSNILSRRVQRFLSLAKTGHSREPLQPVLFLLSITFTIIRITRITFVFFFFLSYVSSDSRGTR